MLRDRYDPTNVFAIVPALTLRTDLVLTHVDRVLDVDVFVARVKKGRGRHSRHSLHRGRSSTPVEVVLCLLVFRRLYRWSYADTVQRVADSLVLRQFCRIYWQTVPDASKLDRCAGVIGEGILPALHEQAVELARDERVTRGRKPRFDGTVVETLIHYPRNESPRLMASGPPLARGRGQDGHGRRERTSSQRHPAGNEDDGDVHAPHRANLLGGEGGQSSIDSQGLIVPLSNGAGAPHGFGRHLAHQLIRHAKYRPLPPCASVRQRQWRVASATLENISDASNDQDRRR